MNGSIALDTSVVIRYLNGNQDIVDHVLQVSSIILPVTVIGELIFGAEKLSLGIFEKMPKIITSSR
jgi:hypothetical protein